MEDACTKSVFGIEEVMYSSSNRSGASKRVNEAVRLVPTWRYCDIQSKAHTIIFLIRELIALPIALPYQLI